MQWGLWKGRHVPGSELAADLLTKSISAATLWEKFYKFMGLVDGVSEKSTWKDRGELWWLQKRRSRLLPQ